VYSDRYVGSETQGITWVEADDRRRDGAPDAAELTRRRLLEAGLLTAGAAALASLPGTASALASGRQALRPLGADLGKVDPREFPSAKVLRRWQRQLDHLGLRATGTRVHEHYIDTLHHRLHRAGVENLRFEAVPFKRWTTSSWKLEIVGGSSAGPVKTASYIPYTGHTSASGVSGQLSVVDPGNPPTPGSLAGKIAVFDVPTTPIPYTAFEALSYKAYDPDGFFTEPGAVYSRPWLGIADLIALLEQIEQAGAVGAVGVLDLPADAARGAYYPYDGTIRGVPGVYVDSAVGDSLKQLAASSANARIAVPSHVVKTRSRNLLGVIPGRSRELMILHSHTDGPNGIEDNGPDAIVAASRYLARQPRHRLPRTILVLLTTGHFIGGRGVESFVARHEHDLVKRAAAAVTLEHLGAEEWNPGDDGHSHLTGTHEPGTVFTPETSPLVNHSFTALKGSRSAPSSVLRPYVPAPGSPDGNGWPAEGTQLWTQGAVPTANFITGPTYLLNWGIPTTDKFNSALARRQAIAFTQMLLRLSRVPRSRLRELDLLS
jgi:hypothetical protein